VRIVQEAFRCAIALDETPAFRESWLEHELKAILTFDEKHVVIDGRQKILLIDDHHPTANSVKEHLEDEYRVTLAYDGQNGLALALESSGSNYS